MFLEYNGLSLTSFQFFQTTIEIKVSIIHFQVKFILKLINTILNRNFNSLLHVIHNGSFAASCGHECDDYRFCLTFSLKMLSHSLQRSLS